MSASTKTNKSDRSSTILAFLNGLQDVSHRCWRTIAGLRIQPWLFLGGEGWRRRPFKDLEGSPGSREPSACRHATHNPKRACSELPASVAPVRESPSGNAFCCTEAGGAGAYRGNGLSQTFPKRGRVRLDTELYEELHQEILRRDGWRCQSCGQSKDLQVHHIQTGIGE